MIQDIAPHRLDNSFAARREARDDDFIVVFSKGNMLLIADGDSKKIAFPTVLEMREKVTVLTYLFALDDKCFFLAEIDDETVDLAPYSFYRLNEVRKWNLEPKDTMYAAFTAFHLATWYMNNRYCGRCGKELVFDDTERAVFCPSCNNKIYPRINPAVIIGIKNGNRLLITRYRTGFANNALVAGFTEIGETFEETVEREVMEEVGLKVKNIRYYKSQPWGIAADILTGFYCEVDGSDEIKMDENELKYAEWVERDEIVLQPQEYSLTNEMMKRFKDGLEK